MDIGIMREKHWQLESWRYLKVNFKIQLFKKNIVDIQTFVQAVVVSCI